MCFVVFTVVVVVAVVATAVVDVGVVLMSLMVVASMVGDFAAVGTCIFLWDVRDLSLKVGVVDLM